MPPTDDDDDGRRVVAVCRQARGGVAMVKPVHAWPLILPTNWTFPCTIYHAHARLRPRAVSVMNMYIHSHGVCIYLIDPCVLYCLYGKAGQWVYGKQLAATLKSLQLIESCLPNDQRLYICAHVYSNLKFIYLYFFYQCFFMVGTTYTALFCFGRTCSLCSMYILILQTNILHVDMCIYCCFS